MVVELVERLVVAFAVCLLVHVTHVAIKVPLTFSLYDTFACTTKGTLLDSLCFVLDALLIVGTLHLALGLIAYHLEVGVHIACDVLTCRCVC